MDARAIAADVEDAVGFACGFVARPGDPRVDADARERLLFVNILGRQVGDARARVDGRGGDGTMASAKRWSLGAASMRVVPTRE